MIRVMIAEDHALMREGLKQMLGTTDDIQVVAEAEDGSDVIDQLRSAEIDLLMLDMSMPGINGEELLARVRSHYPKLCILVVSMHNAPQIAQRAIKAGANGYITKDRHPKTLFSAIRTVAGGGRFLDFQLSQEIAFDNPPASAGDPARLSNREFQVLRLLASGMAVNEIAANLSISYKTVSTHKTRLMEKMGFTSNAELVRYAVRHGLCE